MVMTRMIGGVVAVMVLTGRQMRLMLLSWTASRSVMCMMVWVWRRVTMTVRRFSVREPR